MSSNEILGAVFVSVSSIIALFFTIGRPIITLNRTLIRFDERLNNMFDKLKNTEVRVTNHGKEIKDVEKRVDNHELRLTILEEREGV